jgi:hypothetical protein
MEAQGLFINLCSLYWSQEGNLSLTKAKRRYKDCNTSVWKELFDEGIVKIQDDHIRINFLDEQFDERQKLSEQNRRNIEKRWENKENDTVVLRAYKDGNGSVYNIEKKREEKKRGEERYNTNTEAFDDITSNYQETESHRTILLNWGWNSATDNDCRALLFHFLESQVDLKAQTKDDIKNHFRRWLNKVPKNELQTLAKKIHERQ